MGYELDIKENESLWTNHKCIKVSCIHSVLVFLLWLQFLKRYIRLEQSYLIFWDINYSTKMVLVQANIITGDSFNYGWKSNR